MRMRSEREVDELVDLARTYCEALAEYRGAAAAGLSPEQDAKARQSIANLSHKLELLKSNNELDRRRASLKRNVVALPAHGRRAAR